MKEPLVSVIITTKNSSSTLLNLFKSIRNQSYKHVEILLIDNNSTDSTKKIAATFTSNIYDFGPERSSQRNFGAKKSKGEFLLFLDSDMELDKEVVRECVYQMLVNPNLGGVVIPEKSFGVGFWANAKELERDMNRGEGFFEAARFIPKKIFNQFSGYDETLTGPEDWDLPRRIERKYPISRVKSRVMHNEGELSLKTLFKKKYYYGLSVDKYLTKQKISIIGPTTVYFLRPGFYKNWKMILKDPLVSLGMVVMLFVETIAGLIGYLKGKVASGK